MSLPRTLTATRWSTLLGLAMVMLLSLPRYWFLHDTTRLTLLAILALAVVTALIGFWRLMATTERQRCPAAFRHLAGCLIGGMALMAIWHWFDVAADHWSVIVSQGAALGLLLHVVIRIWRRR
ncbi:hypothetical protein [Salinicola halimionae]|uniref:hypothetical protein n=1 Tax=Salinicola halimionae TaxID=1949081 RepID=UPI0013005FC0|nr:hypothetical protein [Salinicola halimionae]